MQYTHTETNGQIAFNDPSNFLMIPCTLHGFEITEELLNYARDLPAIGDYTNKEVVQITGLGKNTVKEIGKQRLLDEYTNYGKSLKKPEKVT